MPHPSTPLTDQFEHSRDRLRAVAYRILGSEAEAEDAVQEAWLRLSRADAGAVDNLNAWLTTVVARICLDMLRRRRAQREEPLDTAAAAAGNSDPEREALLADSVGIALITMLDTLTPAERVAFVLHDMFDLPFDDIARIVERTPTATRQLASRARRRVRQTTASRGSSDVHRRQHIVDAFLAASRNGDLHTLVALLHPDAVLRADAAAVAIGAAEVIHGAESVATRFAGHAKAAQAAVIDGNPGLVWRQHRTTRVVFSFSFDAGRRITEIALIADAECIAQMHLDVP